MLLFDRLRAPTSSTCKVAARRCSGEPVLVLRPPGGLHPDSAGFAYVSEIIPVFCRKVIFGYPLGGATVSIGFISLGVWVHHMFALGLSPMVNTIFMGSTFLIAIPTGIKMFNWVGTMFGGKIRFDTPMLFSTGFLAMFLIGGLTGVMLATVPFDWQVSDSYFVVGHFHYVLFGGLVFSIFAAIYYWFPKVTGRMLSETWASGSSGCSSSAST